MIKANEFRIGIYVYEKTHSDKYPELAMKRLTEDDLEALFAARNYEDYDPIRLTPEIVELCTFPDIGYLRACLISGNTKYLHQLQNLYFALEGIELEIKLPALSA